MGSFFSSHQTTSTSTLGKTIPVLVPFTLTPEEHEHSKHVMTSFVKHCMRTMPDILPNDSSDTIFHYCATRLAKSRTIEPFLDSGAKVTFTHRNGEIDMSTVPRLDCITSDTCCTGVTPTVSTAV